MTTASYLEMVNALRKANKNKWVQIPSIIVDGKMIAIKFYNTWVQILRIDGIICSGPMDCKVREFNAFLTQALSN